jgi:diacylglycerol kinase family enzyme
MSVLHPQTTPLARIVVVINPHAGGETEAAFEATLSEHFRAHGRDVQILHGGMGVDLRGLLGTAQVGTGDIVVAGGGDGTVSAIAAELAGTDRTLGVLPLGTLNHFAKDLGIPLDLEGAVRTIAEGSVRRIDVGEVNGRTFVNNSGLGIYPQVVLEREAHQAARRIGKWPAFARATLGAFRRYPFLKLRIHVEGNERSIKTACVFIGNNEYEMGGLRIGGRRCLEAGKLGFYVANRTGRLGLLRLAARALVGRLNQAKDFEAFCIEEAWIDSRKHHLLVTTDGEVTRMKPPLHYRIRPGALRVLVPPEAATA